MDRLTRALEPFYPKYTQKDNYSFWFSTDVRDWYGAGKKLQSRRKSDAKRKRKVK